MPRYPLHLPALSRPSRRHSNWSARLQPRTAAAQTGIAQQSAPLASATSQPPRRERVIVTRLDNSSQAPTSTGSTLGTASLLIDYLFRQPIDSLHATDVMVSTQTGQFAALDLAPTSRAWS
ncbi:MAG: hypothetical protein ABI601_08330 [bacterium]